MDNHEDFSSEILRGSAAIGKFIGLPRHRVARLAAAGQIPAVRELKLWVSSKSALRQFYSPGRVQQTLPGMDRLAVAGK